MLVAIAVPVYIYSVIDGSSSAGIIVISPWYEATKPESMNPPAYPPAQNASILSRLPWRTCPAHL